MRTLLAVVGLALALACHAQAPDVAWPREVKGADGTVVTLYQPQVESWADNKLAGRAAVAVIRPGEKEPTYGVIELSARTAIDKASDVATLSEVRVTKSSFPGASEEEAKRYLEMMRTAVKKTTWPVSLQALQANLAITQARSKQKGQAVKNDPPQILFRTAPAMLVLIDGEPALRPLKEAASLQRVINTSGLILQDSATSMTYLWALGRWWAAAIISGDWKPVAIPPASLEPARSMLDKQYNPLDGTGADGKPIFDANVV